MATPATSKTTRWYCSLLIFLLILCAGLSIGLTFEPCYSSMCVEKYFPYRARIHIAVFYGLLTSIALGLAGRVNSKSILDILATYVSAAIIPFVGKRITIGGLALGLWVAALTFGSIGYWYPAEHAYWTARGDLAHWSQYMYRVIWTGVTGHWCDIWIGLVIIPAGRRSLLGQLFQLQTSTLLFVHKALAYTLTVGALVHGLLYYSFVAAWVTTESSDIMYQFIPDNPTLTWREAGVKGPYSWFTLPTGAISGIVLIPIIVITSLPVLRRINYNTFYFIHVIFATAIIVLVCLHASTNFYFLLPGILLWLGDWSWRVGNAVSSRVEVTVENAGGDWYRIRLPPAKHNDLESIERHTSSEKLLATYWINIPAVSKIQLHPFSAASIEDATKGSVLLFQRGPIRKKQKRTDREWTWKLANLVDTVNHPEKQIALDARIEGPYYPPLPGLDEADHIVAIVGGTGITGALLLAKWWAHCFASPAPQQQKSFRLVWTIRERATEQFAEVEEVQSSMREAQNMNFSINVSSLDGRICAGNILSRVWTSEDKVQGRIWIYGSGPEGLLADIEAACVRKRRLLRRERHVGQVVDIVELDWYLTRYLL